MKSNLASAVKKGKMTKEAADAVAARVRGTLDYDDFGSVDMVSIDAGMLLLSQGQASELVTLPYNFHACHTVWDLGS